MALATVFQRAADNQFCAKHIPMRIPTCRFRLQATGHHNCSDVPHRLPVLAVLMPSGGSSALCEALHKADEQASYFIRPPLHCMVIDLQRANLIYRR